MEPNRDQTEDFKYCRDRVGIDPLRAKLDLLWETSEQIQRLRTDTQNLDAESEKILGSKQDLEIASSMLDKALSMQIFELSEQTLKKAVKENQMSQSEADKVNTLRTAEQRRFALMNMRMAQERDLETYPI